MMKRRTFVKSTLITGAASAIVPAAGKATTLKTAGQEYYELRIYHLKDEVQQQLVEGYLKDAAILVLNNLGVKHVGVFTEMKPSGQTKLFVLTQYNSLDHYSLVTAGVDKDTTGKGSGIAYLNAPAKQPAYERMESSLLKAFTHWPILMAHNKSPRILELRQYQSPGEVSGKKKIDMFNNQGEIDIFNRLGFNPVFWGETVIGADMPNLTYMLTFDDIDAKNAHWKAFGADPEWIKIKSIPENADALLINKITSTLLIPTSYSQI